MSGEVAGARWHNPGMTPRAASARSLALLLAAVLAFAACGSNSQTPAPSQAASGSPASSAQASGGPGGSASPGASGSAGAGDIVAIARAIEEQVVKIRGLSQKTAVDPKVVDQKAITDYITRSFDKDLDPRQVAADERLAKLLGVIPQSASLLDLTKELYGSQVVGLYSPDDKTLFVLQTGAGMSPSVKVTYSHEFTHALQDQHFDLVAYSKLTDDRTQGDRSLAAVSLVEGDASAVMTVWSQTSLTMQELLQVAQEASDPQAAATMARLPVILRETALFPYTQGLGFVTSLVQSGGWPAVDKAFASPPASTEQVMHFDKYVAREAPVQVSLPDGLADRMGSGWTVGTTDTWGEFQISIWLRGASGASTAATANAAAGWGGDRVALLDGPGGARGAVWATAWDTAADATEFAAAARAAIASFKLSAEVVAQPGSRTVTLLIGSDDAVTNRLHVILGAGGV